MIVLLCCVVIIGSAISLYFSWRAGKHLDKAMMHTEIAIEASGIAIQALHCRNNDELEILHQRLENLKRKKQ